MRIRRKSYLRISSPLFLLPILASCMQRTEANLTRSPKARDEHEQSSYKISQRSEGIGFVGNMVPSPGEAIRRDEADSSDLAVSIQVYQVGVTPGVGKGAGIDCFLSWGKVGQEWQDLAMEYVRDRDGLTPGDNSNDEYQASIPASGLAIGTYGFSAYCTADTITRIWRSDGGYDRGLFTVVPDSEKDAISPSTSDGVFFHAFEWKWTDIEKECTFAQTKGYKAIQVSPPTEHVIPVADMNNEPGSDFPWWVRYQPVTHDINKLNSRSGSLREFKQMVDSCRDRGIDIYVDAVINHTTGVGSGDGTSGSTFAEYKYPQYGLDNFHQCGTNYPDKTPNDISDYTNRREIQNCELANLADLNTDRDDVRDRLRNYFQSLLDIGVAGFRIDAAKHIPASDINAILSGLSLPNGGRPYVFQEVIEAINEPIKAFEYTPNGDVTEFGYSRRVGEIFNGCNRGSLKDLESFTEDLLDSSFAVIFTDNHDNQRGHGAGGPCILDHRDVDSYNLGNIFMLAFPYGYPKEMSSYYWRKDPFENEGDSKGPPSTQVPFSAGSGPETRPVYGPNQVAGDVPDFCSDVFEDGKWVCEHRRPEIANMVRFRAVTAGEPVSNWQNWGEERIAFGRGEKGFVIINNESSSSSHTFTTKLPSGTYCDITKGELRSNICSGRKFVVEPDGTLTLEVDPFDAIALHVQAVEE